MKGLENPYLGLLIGTIFTAMIHSSAAFIGIVIILGQQQLISLEAGIPMMMGANVGTCITAALASIGTSREAKRVAIAHTLFKLGGVTLFIFWIPTFSKIVIYFTQHFTGGDMPRQIANAHSIFNIALAFAFLPFTQYFSRIIFKILPEKPEDSKMPITWKIDESVITTPSLALALARNEMLRMAKILNNMLVDIIKPFITNAKLRDSTDPKMTFLEGMNLKESQIDFLDENIYEFLIKIARQKLSEAEINEVYGLMSIASHLESIGDIIHRNLVPLVDKKHALVSDFTKEGKEEILIYHQKVCKQISRLEEAIGGFNLFQARKIMKKVEIYLDLEAKYRIRHLERIRQKKQKSLETHEVHMELMDLLKQINVYTGNIAKLLTEIIYEDTSEEIEEKELLQPV
jgi:phosphate:Na+ symporter